IMQMAASKITAHLQLSRCLFVEINPTKDTATVIYDWRTQAFPSLVGAYRLADFHSDSELQQLSNGQALIVPDTVAMPLGTPAAEGFARLNIKALVNAPYLTQGGWRFSLCAMQSESRQWQSDEIDLLQELSTRIWLRLERAYAETALQISEEQRRLALDLTGTAAWSWDLTSGDLVWSNNLFQLLGLPPSSEPPTYELWRNSVHPEDLERVEAAVPVHLENQTLYSQEYRIVYPDSTIRWHLSLGHGVYDQSGQALRMVGITLDITDRKQLELAFQASEAKLSRILDSAIAVIVSFRVWTNRDWEYDYWSAGCEQLYGFSAAEMRADKHLWLSQVDPYDRETLLLPLFGVFFTEQNVTAEYRFHHKNGSIRWICSVYASQQIEPDCWQVTSVNYDVTDRKSLEQELLQINAELEQRVRARTLELEQALLAAEVANAAKSTFLATMSHELRTPLNAILGFSELLGRDPTLGSDQQEQVEIINRSGEQLLGLINDILQMAKLKTDQTALSLNLVDLGQLLQQLENRFRGPAEAKGLQLTIHCAASVPQSIQADGPKLYQVLAKLLGNAIKFTQSGQIRLRVQLQTAPASPAPVSLLHFSVQDNGPGIDPLEQDLVFRPFVRTKTGQDSQEGTGLGLSISREFVRLMGGELNFSSSPGQGATFFFQIPVTPLAATSVQLSPTAEDAAIDSSPVSLLAVLQTMPQDWIDRLQQAARMADDELIEQLLNQISPAEAQFATTLKVWVDQFRFDKLIELTLAAAPAPDGL
ncbi:MAG: PAS domain-containing protein, partial [Elainella sp.]